MHAIAIVDALKRMLKGRGITYANVAAGLGLSEASVKRMFSRRDFTLQRLEDVCRVAGQSGHCVAGSKCLFHHLPAGAACGSDNQQSPRLLGGSGEACPISSFCCGCRGYGCGMRHC